MPKTRNTNAMRRERLYERITPTYLIAHTSIFNDPIGGDKLDPYTVGIIKANYKRFFTSWVEEDAKRFILNEKINAKNEQQNA